MSGHSHEGQLKMRIQARASPLRAWLTEAVRRGERLDQHVNRMTFLPDAATNLSHHLRKSGFASFWQTRKRRRPDTGAFISLGPDGSASSTFLTPPLMRKKKEGRGGEDTLEEEEFVRKKGAQ